ncbi:MAG: CoA-binding protein [FCB group bacterium]|nr:CoA-binding protein [FCB group bacterium]
MNTIEEILAMRTIAIVGLSPNPARPSHGVGLYLIANGYEVIPVNPGHTEILGLTSYPTLKDIPVKVDIVDVFRKGEACLPIAKTAIEIGAKALWLQEGVRNDEAVKIASDAGLLTVQDRCILKEHRKSLSSP